MVSSVPGAPAASSSSAAVSSPYAPFCAAEWSAVVSSGARPSRPAPVAAAGWVCWVQGDLFAAGPSAGCR